MTEGRHRQERLVYEIRVSGILEEGWSDWPGGLTVRAQGEETLLAGPVRDQSALHGILACIRDLGLPLLSVTRVDETNEEDDSQRDG